MLENSIDIEPATFSVFGLLKFRNWPALISIFWYLALFPARLPFDSSDAVRMMQRGESTEQWTPLFFWFLRLSTFWGRQVWLASFLIALGFYFSLKFIVESLPISVKAKLWTRIIFSLSPIYGYWSVTVSHDATSAIGMMFLIGVLLKLFETNSMNGLYKFILIGILKIRAYGIKESNWWVYSVSLYWDYCYLGDVANDFTTTYEC